MRIQKTKQRSRDYGLDLLKYRTKSLLFEKACRDIGSSAVRALIRAVLRPGKSGLSSSLFVLLPGQPRYTKVVYTRRSQPCTLGIVAKSGGRATGSPFRFQ